jgi:tRNA threonylcarbamoyladenosine modification (KEOPS) complex  Pcc1 subunit
LKEKEALEGLSVDPKILIEIQDIEEKIERLQLELRELKTQKSRPFVSSDDLNKIKITIRADDVTTFEADVIALKFAQALYGADFAVSKVLGKSESDIQKSLPEIGQHKLFFSNGRIKAKQVLFFSVVDLYLFGYEEIRKFSKDVLNTLANIAPQTKHLAMTIHGVGYGLDEAEALRSQLAGYFDAFDSNNYPPALEQITIVERRSDRVQRLESILREAIPGNTVVLPKVTAIQEKASQFITRSPSIRNVGRQSSTKPYILIAISPEDTEDIYYYGIQSPINKAGYLCERLDLTLLTNDIIERIKLRIEAACLVIAELTNPNPNILLEVGYAWGKGCPTLFLAQSKEKLTFGVDGQRCIFYNRIRDLEENLAKELQLLNL